nr:type I restriction-modification system, specificity subunit S [uncultured bacterium]
MQLLQHFKELTLRPKNAQELKGLILELALRGRLTNNFSLNRQKNQNDIVQGYYKLPRDWYWDKFDNISNFQMGKTPPSKEMEYWEGIHPWISIADMATYSTITHTKKTLSDKGLNNYFKNGLVKKGTLLMSFKLTIGKTSILGVDACHNEAIISIYPKEKVLQKYLFLFLPVISHWGVQVNALMGKTLNKGKIQNMNIPIPPLEEQKEIVKVVETLFKEVEQLEHLTVARIGLKEDFVSSALQQLTTNSTNQEEWINLQEHFKSFFNETTNIKKLRETILQLAVQGKLTRAFRESHPELVSGLHHASNLLKRIQKEKAQLIKDKKIKNEKALPPITEDEIPYELPEGWVWCRLGTVTDIIAGASFKSGDFNKTEGVKCIKITNAGVRSFVETNDYLPKDFDKLHPSYLIKEGDLILALTRPYIKDGLKISICPSTYNNSLLNQRVASIRSMTSGIYHPYIFTFIQTPKVLNYYKSKFDDKSQQPNMKMGDITDLPISLPPLEEQKAIVEKVNALMGLCDALEQEVQQSQQHSEMMMQSVLKEVFEGRKEVAN